MKSRNFRRRKLDTDEEEEQEDEIIIKKLNEVKNDQIQRKRQRGLEAQTILEQSQLQSKNETNKSIKSLIGSQFSVQNSSGAQNGISHEKILEKYIQEKIGVVDLRSEEKKNGSSDELFQVPEELKALEGVKVSTGEGSGPGRSWSMGIAEVALPIDYKLQNIEATEIARKKVEENLSSIQQQPKKSETVIFQSQRLTVPTRTTPHLMTSFVNRNKSSSDDATLERFKKRQQR